MKQLLPYILLGYFALLTACTFEDEPAVCPYNTRLEYWYAGYALENRLRLRVDRLQEYIFNETGELVSHRTLKNDSLTGHEQTLMPGRYTVVLWGNLYPNPTDSIVVQGDTLLGNHNIVSFPQQKGTSYRGNGSSLYYGSGSFTVGDGAMTKHKIYVSHAHTKLKITVIWHTDRPNLDGPLRMRLRNVPSLYSFIPGAQIPVSNGAGPHLYPAMGNTRVSHETPAYEDYAKDVTGEFVTRRFTNDTHPLWSLYCGDRQVVKELDLWDYFHESFISMENNVEQEFHLLVIIGDNKIVVMEVSGTDWDEGGLIG